jgi:hypothetical protein
MPNPLLPATRLLLRLSGFFEAIMRLSDANFLYGLTVKMPSPLLYAVQVNSDNTAAFGTPTSPLSPNRDL